MVKSKTKKLFVGLICACSLLVLSLGVVGCGKSTDSKTFSSAAEAYAFGAVSSIKLLSANTTSESEQNEANAENSYARNVPTNEQITFAQRVDEYVDVVDGFIGGSSPVKIQEESLTDAEYSTKVTTDITHLSGQKDSFVMYYNETVPTEDDRKTDDDDDFEVNTRLSGIVEFGGQTYSLRGEKEVEQDEIEINLEIKIDDANYVIIQTETENGEQEYGYEVYSNGQKVEELSLEIEIEQNEVEVELFVAVNGETQSFKFEKETENNITEIKINCNVNGNTETIFAVYDEGTQRYIYTFGSNNASVAVDCD